MIKKILKNKSWLVMGLCLMFALPYSNTFASDRDRDRGRPHEIVIVGHERYHYRNGRFYRPGWFGFKFIVATPPIGAIVTIIPFGHRTVIVAGVTYYYYDRVYYRPCPSGYIVVPPPVANANIVSVSGAAPPQTLSGEIVIINVPNSNGSYTPVKLVKHNNGYIGPQGEYYPGHPSVDQLRALYGR